MTDSKEKVALARIALETIADIGTPPPSRQGSHDSPRIFQTTTPQTPPQSTTCSPLLKLEACTPCPSQDYAFNHPSLRQATPKTSTSPPTQLPGLNQFDKGVEELHRLYGTPNRAVPQSPAPPPQNFLPLSRAAPFESSLPLNQLYAPPPPRDPHHRVHHYPSNSLDSYPSPPPDSNKRDKSRHINQKYTTEQGDFIIYQWHDMKQKWLDIRDRFHDVFGSEPNRTIQGLQAWYYRMNTKIPQFDPLHGYLYFPDEEDSVEPIQVAIKCRERDGSNKPMEPMGLAQRYPERAVMYPWLDPGTKARCRDWAFKRNKQYADRAERRRRKQERRANM